MDMGETMLTLGGITVPTLHLGYVTMTEKAQRAKHLRWIRKITGWTALSTRVVVWRADRALTSALRAPRSRGRHR